MLRSWSATAPWHSREVEIVLPATVASTMRERARKWDVESGGRFDAHSSAVLLWSKPIQLDQTFPVLMGSLFIRWGKPTEDRATIYAIAWDPEAGGSEEELRKAINVLAGELVSV